ncbi:MAG: hypothetical protein MI799_19700 [Desulfobacterales bacterium]|nr:hypothetical protein [Desulfobacterales bacterium]
MTKMLPEQTVERMTEIIKDAVAFSGTRDTALVAMLPPGHGIPLAYTCGAVLDYDMIRIESFCMGWGNVFGVVTSEDCPDDPMPVRLPLTDIVWLVPEVVEVT